MSEDKRYNGWTNYETWAIHLWLTNDKASYDASRAEAQRCFEEAARPEMRGWKEQTQRECAAILLADILKADHEEAVPELEGFAGDLLAAAMSEIDWYEVATALLGDISEESEAVNG